MIRSFSFMIIAICFLLYSFSPPLAQQNEWALDWALKKNSNGIKVYTATKGDSKYDAFKAVTTLNVPIAKVTEQLKDAPTYTQWLDKCIENRLTKRVTEKSYYVYTVINFPAFSSDRDVHSRVKVNETASGQIHIAVTRVSVSEVGTVSNTCSSCITMPNFSGNWILTPIDAQTTEVIYQAHAEPGGSLSAWLVDMFLVKSPYNTLKNFQNLLEHK